MSQHLPYRIELRTLTHAKLAELNAQREARGEPPFLPANEEFLEIDLSTEASPEDIERWLAHPDERVFLAYIDAITKDDRTERLTGLHIRDAHGAAVRAAIERAASEGVVWTPLINAVYQRSVWWAATEGGAPLKDAPTPREQVERLVPWLEQETDSAALAGLLQFQNQLLLQVLARHGRHLSLDLLRTLSEKGCLIHLSKNLALSERAVEWVVREVIVWGRPDTEEAIAALNQRGVGISDRVFQQVFLEKARTNATKGDVIDQGMLNRRRSLLLKFEHLTLAQLQDLVVGLGASGVDWVDIHTWCEVATHPSADLDLIRRAYKTIPADNAGRTTILYAHANRPDVIADPFFRNEYRRHSAWFLRFAVVEDLNDEELEDIIKRMEVIAKPDELCRALQLPGRRIPRRVIEPLLEHPDQAVRMAAIGALSSMDDRDRASRSQGKQSRSA